MPAPPIKVAALCALVALASACYRERVRPAPFRQRPDAVTSGDLRGPFDGQVTDASSGDPISGAMVYAAWTLETGYGLSAPAGFREVVTSTNADGRYSVPRMNDIPSTARLTSFHMVIYKRGYVAYRSDRRFSDFSPRHDFAQRRNEALLDRWHSDYSHTRHLRFVGGGPPIRALVAWEIEPAVAERNGEPTTDSGDSVSALAPTRVGTRVNAAQILADAEIREVTGYEGDFETGPLNDEPDTDSYSSQHFRALGQPETFDVAVRMWKLAPGEAQKRYGELLESLPGVEETNDIADRSLRAVEGSIFGAGFLDGKRGIVVLITCGQSQCKSLDQLGSLAATAHRNVLTLSALGGAK